GMAEPKKMMKKEVSFMKKKGAPKSMIKHEEAEMSGMGSGMGMGMGNGGAAAILGPMGSMTGQMTMMDMMSCQGAYGGMSMGGMGMGMGMGMGGMGGMGMGMGSLEMATAGDSHNPCWEAINSGVQVLKNQQNLCILNFNMVGAGLDAISTLMKGLVLKQQSKRIQEIISNVPDEKATKPPLSNMERDLVNSICQLAPQSQICKDFKSSQRGWHSNLINVEGIGTQGRVSRVKDNDLGNYATADGGYNDNEMDGVAYDGDFGKNFDDNMGAGDNNFGGDSGGGMGGGGGGGGMVLEQAMAPQDSGQGGAVGDQGGMGGNGDSGSYEGGLSGRSLSPSSGGSRMASNSNRSGGSDSTNTATSGVMGFRNPSGDLADEVGSKNGLGLFKMIHNRYQASVGKERLLEFEQVDPLAQ
ncbi:MAG: hypothetical protein ACO20H_13645, partial [Bacteriovoracaceae bacterium]